MRKTPSRDEVNLIWETRCCSVIQFNQTKLHMNCRVWFSVWRRKTFPFAVFRLKCLYKIYVMLQPTMFTLEKWKTNWKHISKKATLVWGTHSHICWAIVQLLLDCNAPPMSLYIHFQLGFQVPANICCTSAATATTAATTTAIAVVDSFSLFFSLSFSLSILLFWLDLIRHFQLIWEEPSRMHHFHASTYVCRSHL